MLEKNVVDLFVPLVSRILFRCTFVSRPHGGKRLSLFKMGYDTPKFHIWKQYKALSVKLNKQNVPFVV